MKQLIYLSLLMPFMAVNTNIQPIIKFGGSNDNLIKTYEAKAQGNMNGLKYDYYQINNYMYNNGINEEIPVDLFINITQIKFTLPSIENINIDLTFLSSITPWKDNQAIVERFTGYIGYYADFLTTQDYTKEMFYINSMNLGNWQNTEIWNEINSVFSYNELAYIVYGDYGENFLRIDNDAIFNPLLGAYGYNIELTKIEDQPAVDLPNTDLTRTININATNTEYKEFYYTKLLIGTCDMQDPNAMNQQGKFVRKTYNYILNKISTNMELLPPSTTPTTTEVIDLPNLLFTILALPFAFISQAFNLTLFPGTPYAVNISNLLITIMGIFILIFVITIIKKVLK